MATFGNTQTSSPGTKDASETVGDNLDALRGDISKLADSVKRLAADQIGVAAAEAQDKALEKIGDLEATIRKNPTQSALIAAGVGFLVGLVMLR